MSITRRRRSHVLGSNSASTAFFRLNICKSDVVSSSQRASQRSERLALFTVPDWLSRTRSIAMTRSCSVKKVAVAGESGSQRRTVVPTTKASPPVFVRLISKCTEQARGFRRTEKQVDNLGERGRG